MDDAAIFRMIFAAEGAVRLTWEVASRCDCYTDNTRQPAWGHEPCGGLGAIYAEPLAITGLFRSQSRWKSRHSSGEHDLMDAQLTTLLAHKPGYTDEKIRDRFTVIGVTDVEGAVFYAQAEAVPFILAGVHRAWRVKVQGLKQATRTLPQP